MGCTDRESNFQTEKFSDGKWGASVGYTPSWEGPIEELVKMFPSYAEPRFLEKDSVYSAEPVNDTVFIVKLIGTVALNSVSTLN